MGFKRIIVLSLLILSFSVLSFGQSGRVRNNNQTAEQNKETTSQTDVYKGSEVDTKAKITDKPQPTFTEEARRKRIGGIIVLHLVLAASGEVKDIVVERGLPLGLTEKAIEAANQIKFTPAIKDGKAVSQQVMVFYSLIVDGITVLADSTKKVYYISHMRMCAPLYTKIPIKDIVSFSDYEDAEAAGYVEAKQTCP